MSPPIPFPRRTDLLAQVQESTRDAILWGVVDRTRKQLQDAEDVLGHATQLSSRFARFAARAQLDALFALYATIAESYRLRPIDWRQLALPYADTERAVAVEAEWRAFAARITDQLLARPLAVRALAHTCVPALADAPEEVHLRLLQQLGEVIIAAGERNPWNADNWPWRDNIGSG